MTTNDPGGPWSAVAHHYIRQGARHVTDELTRLLAAGPLTSETVLAARDWAEDPEWDGTNLVEVPVTTEPPPPITVTITDDRGNVTRHVVLKPRLPPDTVPYGVQCDVCLRPDPHRHCPSCSSTEIDPTEATCLRCSIVAARELTQ